jgi:hypothetical protein
MTHWIEGASPSCRLLNRTTWDCPLLLQLSHYHRQSQQQPGPLTVMSYSLGSMSLHSRAAAHPVPSTTSLGRPVCRGRVSGVYSTRSPCAVANVLLPLKILLRGCCVVFDTVLLVEEQQLLDSSCLLRLWRHPLSRDLIGGWFHYSYT